MGIRGEAMTILYTMDVANKQGVPVSLKTTDDLMLATFRYGPPYHGYIFRASEARHKSLFLLEEVLVHHQIETSRFPALALPYEEVTLGGYQIGVVNIADFWVAITLLCQ